MLDLSGTTVLSFFTRTDATPGFNDLLEVRFSSGSGTDLAGFTTLLATIGGDAGYPADWTQFSATLDASGSGRFAFRYFGPADTLNYVGLDTVSVVTAVPEPASWLMLALGARPAAACSAAARVRHAMTEESAMSKQTLLTLSARRRAVRARACSPSPGPRRRPGRHGRGHATRRPAKARARRRTKCRPCAPAAPPSRRRWPAGPPASQASVLTRRDGARGVRVGEIAPGLRSRHARRRRQAVQPVRPGRGRRPGRAAPIPPTPSTRRATMKPADMLACACNAGAAAVAAPRLRPRCSAP